MLCFAFMVTVRLMTLDDLPKLYPLWQEQMSLLGQSDKRLMPDADAPSNWHMAMAAALNDVRALLVTGWDELPNPVGFAVGWEAPVGMLPGLTGRTAVIGDLVIDMHRYRGGAARQLVTAVREGFAARGITRLVAISARRHPTAQAFWRSLGAVEWMDCFWLS